VERYQTRGTAARGFERKRPHKRGEGGDGQRGGIDYVVTVIIKGKRADSLLEGGGVGEG